MRTFKNIAVLGFLIAKNGCALPPEPSRLDRRMGDPVTQLCYPHYDEYIISGSAPSLIDSPYPCEVQAAMEFICSPNGTTTLDFLAEQECLCNGAFFDVSRGCNNCFFFHGEGGYTPSDAVKYFSALSAAECSASPTQPYQSIAASFSSAASNSYSSTWLAIDPHPTDMAASYYWTATGSVTIGAITGNATARATTNIRWSIIGDTTLVMTPGSSTSSGASPSGASTTISISLSNTSGSRNVAAIDAMGACAGLLTLLITFVVLL